jgi:hypothetical protein
LAQVKPSLAGNMGLVLKGPVTHYLIHANSIRVPHVRVSVARISYFATIGDNHVCGFLLKKAA